MEVLTEVGLHITCCVVSGSASSQISPSASVSGQRHEPVTTADQPPSTPQKRWYDSPTAP